MSNFTKINYTLLSILGTALCTSITVVWMAAGKASAIDTATLNITSLSAEIGDLRKRDDQHAQMLSRLDERTIQILKILEARLK